MLFRQQLGSQKSYFKQANGVVEERNVWGVRLSRAVYWVRFFLQFFSTVECVRIECDLPGTAGPLCLLKLSDAICASSVINLLLTQHTFEIESDWQTQIGDIFLRKLDVSSVEVSIPTGTWIWRVSRMGNASLKLIKQKRVWRSDLVVLQVKLLSVLPVSRRGIGLCPVCFTSNRASC